MSHTRARLWHEAHASRVRAGRGNCSSRWVLLPASGNAHARLAGLKTEVFWLRYLRGNSPSGSVLWIPAKKPLSGIYDCKHSGKAAKSTMVTRPKMKSKWEAANYRATESNLTIRQTRGRLKRVLRVTRTSRVKSRGGTGSQPWTLPGTWEQSRANGAFAVVRQAHIRGPGV